MLAPLVGQPVGGVRGNEGHRRFAEGHVGLLGAQCRKQGVAARHGVADPGGDRLRVEVHVGKGHEETLGQEGIGVGRHQTFSFGSVGHEGQALEGVDEGVLQGRYRVLLAAHPLGGAGL